MISAPLAAARAAQHAQLVRRVHAAKTWLKLDDDLYRAALASHSGGKASSKACSVGELQALLEHFHRCGFPRPAVAGRKPLSPKQKKMFALWCALADAGLVRDRGMGALLKWIAGQTDNRVQRLDWLTPAQEDTLIESLKKWRDRA